MDEFCSIKSVPRILKAFYLGGADTGVAAEVTRPCVEVAGMMPPDVPDDLP